MTEASWVFLAWMVPLSFGLMFCVFGYVLLAQRVSALEGKKRKPRVAKVPAV